MEFKKGKRFIGTYYEAGKMLVVKDGNKWQVWKQYNDMNGERTILTDGYSLEFGNVKTLKDAKETAELYA